MASKRQLRRKQCGTKNQFATAQQAQDFLIRRCIKGQCPYRCKWCGHFHTGHPSKETRQSMEATKES